MTELKPCPFCGSTDLSHEVDDGLAWKKCDKCGATGPAVSKYDEDGDPDWNTRTPPPVDSELVERVSDEIARLDSERIRVIGADINLPKHLHRNRSYTLELEQQIGLLQDCLKALKGSDG